VWAASARGFFTPSFSLRARVVSAVTEFNQLYYNGLRNVVWWSVVVGGSDVFSAFRLFGISSPSIPTKNSIPARLLGAASFSGRLARP
jgi:hypothetical protein